MALIHCDFFSDVLQVSTTMTVVLPQRTSAQIGVPVASEFGQYPTLYLLHGLSDGHSAWQRYTSIERYVARRGIAVVMPQVNRSFYTDECHGHRYWTFLTEELPAIAGRFFQLSQRREDTFVAGLSMGGYGAMKWALRQPERFAAAASLSGALDVVRIQQRVNGSDGPEPDAEHLMDRVFGPEPLAGTDNDLLWLVRRFAKTSAAAGVEMPQLYLCCGTEDFIYQDTITFHEACLRAAVPATLDCEPGEHEWGYWDRKIRDILDWLPVQRQLVEQAK